MMNTFQKIVCIVAQIIVAEIIGRTFHAASHFLATQNLGVANVNICRDSLQSHF